MPTSSGTARPTARLRALLRREGLIVAPFCHDAMTAAIAEQLGFDAVYMTGFGTAAALAAKPDVGLLTLTEMVMNARYIASAVRIPVIADADTGYGNPINVWRTVEEYERAGVAAIHIEDQVWPKKCGFFEGKRVIPCDEMVAKIRAALDARGDPDFVIIARTDALAVHGWEDTIKRARAYADAGADLVFVDGIRTKEDLETYAHSLAGVPLLYNGALVTTQEAEKMGFKIVITGTAFFAAFAAVKDLFQELKETGATTSLTQVGRRMGDLLAVLHMDRIQEMEKAYGPSEGGQEE